MSSNLCFSEMKMWHNEGERLPPSQRIWKYCTSGLCEDEFHFMIHCDLYKDFRSDLLNTIKSLFPFIELYSNIDLYQWIMCNLDHDVILATGKYVHMSFMKRKNTNPISDNM